MTKVELSTIGRFTTGGTPSRKHDEFFHGYIPWVSTVALNGGHVDAADAQQLITEEAVQNSATKLIPAGSIFVGIRVGVGKVAINDVPMCTNQDIVAISGVKTDEWDIDYLCFAIQAQSDYLLSQKQGATISGISSKLLKAVEIERKTLEEQRHIVGCLEETHSLKETIKRMLAKTDELVQSRFIEMFGDPIQEIDRWPRRKMNDLYVVTSAKRIYAKDLQTSGVPFLKLGDLTSRIAGDESLCSGYVDSETFARLRMNDQVPQAGDILVTARGTMGLCYVVKPTDDFYFQDGMITWLKQRKDSPDPLFLVHLFAMPSFRNQLLGITSGTTVSYLSIKALSNTEIPVPPIELQREFAAFVRQVESLKIGLNQQLDRLNTLYDSLTQRYFA